jgi:thiamine biosynthesis protein ThiS
MKIMVNGRNIDFFKNSMQELLDQYGINPSKVFIEKNGMILSAVDYTKVLLSEGDSVDIGRNPLKKKK